MKGIFFAFSSRIYRLKNNSVPPRAPYVHSLFLVPINRQRHLTELDNDTVLYMLQHIIEQVKRRRKEVDKCAVVGALFYGLNMS